MKRSIWILLGVLVILSMIAAQCGGGAAPATEAPKATEAATKAPEPTKAPEATKAPEPTKAPEATATEAAAPATSKLGVKPAPEAKETTKTAEWDKVVADFAKSIGLTNYDYEALELPAETTWDDVMKYYDDQAKEAGWSGEGESQDFEGGKLGAWINKETNTVLIIFYFASADGKAPVYVLTVGGTIPSATATEAAATEAATEAAATEAATEAAATKAATEAAATEAAATEAAPAATEAAVALPAGCTPESGKGVLMVTNFTEKEITMDIAGQTKKVPGQDTAPKGGIVCFQLAAGKITWNANMADGSTGTGDAEIKAGEVTELALGR